VLALEDISFLLYILLSFLLICLTCRLIITSMKSLMIDELINEKLKAIRARRKRELDRINKEKKTTNTNN